MREMERLIIKVMGAIMLPHINGEIEMELG
jgi:hypothetical protein